jgi:2',3'-cyclic-nucleotide 2'-phosphodiesterase/3'-nucleotidase
MSVCREFAKDLGPLPRDASLVHLRVLATADLHATLMPFDYYSDSADDRVGLVRIAGLVEAARADTPNCLLFDNGDTFQGGALGDLAAEEAASGNGPHPMIVAMNALGYDAATLGNHDFDYGIDLLRGFLADAGFPVVLANAQYPGNGEPFRPRHVLLERDVQDLDGAWHVLRIGVTGTVPPQVSRWNRFILNGDLIFGDAVAAAACEAQFLKAAGADIVVVLTHSGLGDCETTLASAGDGPDMGKENVARTIAALADVDVVIAGHTHEVYPPAGDCDIVPPNVPIVQPGSLGSHLGCIDLALVRQRDGDGWTILKADAEALPLDGTARDMGAQALRAFVRARPGLRKTIGASHRATRAETARQIGASAVPLHTFFSVIAPCAATQLMSDAQRATARAALADHAGLRDLPLVSAVSPMRGGGRAGPDQFTDIPAGPLLLRHISDLYCYPNSLSILRVRGRDIPAWLERSASVFLRIDPDDPSPQPMIDHDFAGYNFDRLDGLIYEIDLSVPARTDAHGEKLFDTPGRIRNLRHADGRPVDPDEDVLIVTNSYRASGGGNFGICAESETVLSVITPVRDCIVEFIRSHRAPIRPEPTPTFTLRGFGRARPVFETGPGALQHAGELAALGLTRLGASDEGFLRLDYRPGNARA